MGTLIVGLRHVIKRVDLIGLDEKALLVILYRLSPVMLKKKDHAQIEREIGIVRESE